MIQGERATICRGSFRFCLLVASCIPLALLLYLPVVIAQAGCPQVNQWIFNGQAHHGLLNGASVTVYVTGALQWANSELVSATSAWRNISGATFSFSGLNVASVPSGQTASAGNPVFTFEYGDASMFTPGGACYDLAANQAADACTLCPQLDSQGHPTIALVWVNPGVNSSYPYFQVIMRHELGHAGFGLAECRGCSTSDTVMALPETSSSGGPTTCDQEWVFDYTNGAYGVDPDSGGDGGLVPRR